MYNKLKASQSELKEHTFFMIETLTHNEYSFARLPTHYNLFPQQENLRLGSKIWTFLMTFSKCKRFAHSVNPCNKYIKLEASPSELNEHTFFMVETLSHTIINKSIRMAESINNGHRCANMFWINGSYHVKIARNQSGGGGGQARMRIWADYNEQWMQPNLLWAISQLHPFQCNLYCCITAICLMYCKLVVHVTVRLYLHLDLVLIVLSVQFHSSVMGDISNCWIMFLFQ